MLYGGPSSLLSTSMRRTLPSRVDLSRAQSEREAFNLHFLQILFLPLFASACTVCLHLSLTVCHPPKTSFSHVCLFLRFPVAIFFSSPDQSSHSPCSFLLPLLLIKSFRSQRSVSFCHSLTLPHTSVWWSAMCSVNIRLGRVYPPSLPERLIKQINKSPQKQLRSSAL